MNRIVLVGRAVRDPEGGQSQGGAAWARFRLAVDGVRDEETLFLDVVCWRKLAETVSAHVRKGRLVGVDGRLRQRTYDDASGARRVSLEVVADRVAFLGRKPDPGTADTPALAVPPEPSG